MTDHSATPQGNGNPKDPVADLEARLAEIESGIRNPLQFTSVTLIQTTWPHSSRAGEKLVLTNGNRTVTMWSRHGLPSGPYPRLIMCWLTREALRRQELPIDEARIIPLSGSLAGFMREVGITRTTGGKAGTITAIRSQMKKLFSTHIGVDYEDVAPGDGFRLEDTHLVDRSHVWWDKRNPDEIDFQGHITLSEDFYRDLVGHAVPLDARILRQIRRSPMAIDIYCWLTYRVSRLRGITVIRWDQIRDQIGSGYPATSRGIRNFRARFLDALEKVLMAWPTDTIAPTETGIMLRPGEPSVPRKITDEMKRTAQRSGVDDPPF